MANDFDDLYDIENMSDEEIKDLVLQELSEYPEIDVDLIEVNVSGGAVRVSGRVGTEQEVQQVEHVLTDVLGVERVANDLVIDELTRGELSEAADEAWVEESSANPQMAQGAARTSDEAEHLMDNVEADQFGTNDMQQASARGTVYEPPTTPQQEGTSRESH
jgi:hypothetical protein